uniref:Uncharacterized protein n=1 Tax=Trichinella nativa TaxID=6335 RepID=A0A0V1IHE5_9BILA
MHGVGTVTGSGKKTAFSTSGVCTTGSQHVEECKSILISLY